MITHAIDIWIRCKLIKDGCWLWNGSLIKNGHPHVAWRGDDSHPAARAVYEFLHGSIPCGHKVLRTCFDNACLKPDHLTLSTTSHLEVSEEEFWTRCTKVPSGCWNWIGATVNGYGSLTRRSKRERANRLAWEFARGPIPKGIQVLHECDNRLCINPDHLFLGTIADNMAHASLHGRVSHGDTHYGAVLTEEDVIGLRDLYSTGTMSHKQIADMCGLNHMTVYDAITRRTWKHVK